MLPPAAGLQTHAATGRRPPTTCRRPPIDRLEVQSLLGFPCPRCIRHRSNQDSGICSQ
ncbi:hypothetical protein LINPERHAP1_LOCUS11935 [Linum perenne]